MPNVDWVFEAVKTLDQALPVSGPGGPRLACRVGDLPDAGAEQFLLGAARCALLFSSDPRYSKTAEAYSDYWRMYFADQPRS